jgi:2-polyprenyl-3-methyl-5-hydroxy-6-metoxy-1,4-benzoquinol methylase
MQWVWQISNWIRARRRTTTEGDYAARLIAEQRAYDDCIDVHELPSIFHYWSNRYLRPKLESFGFSSPNDFFGAYLQRQCQRDISKSNCFISIGAGNCDTEVLLSRSLLDASVTNFTIECIDLNSAMLARGKQLAEQHGVAVHIAFVQSDFNRWRPTKTYDAVIANQSLHHVLEIENLMSHVRQSLKPDGVFLISDMIGRNGHLRWPEALEIVHEFWRQMPSQYRYNHQLKRHEDLYENWDCSAEGFEGIKAQEILPLLVKLFQFELFIAYANVVDVFIERGFGHNFSPDREWDRHFIDQIHARDEYELTQRRIKPTHLLALARVGWSGELKYHHPFTPEFCVRHS